MTSDPHLIAKISTCTSTAELRGLLDALRMRGVALTEAQERAAQVKKAALLEDDRARGRRR